MIKHPRRHRTLHGLIALSLISAVGAAGIAYAHSDGDSQRSDRHMERLDRMLSEADQNGDGALTLDEMTAHHQARFDRADSDGDAQVTRAEVHKQMATQHFTALDTNGDGMLSPDEFAAMATRHGMGPGGKMRGHMGSHMGSHIGGQMGYHHGEGHDAEHGQRYDDDDHGTYHEGHRRGDHRGGHGARMFQWLDQDENGAIDRAEVEAMSARMFERMDRTGDGQIDADDLAR